MSGSKGKATTGGTKRAGKASADGPVITADALRFLRQSDGIAENDLVQWENALTESFQHEGQTLYGRALVLRGLLNVDGFVVSDYVARARASFTDKGMAVPPGLTEGTFSRLGVLVLAIAHGISPEATAATDRRRWSDVCSTAWGNGPGRSGALRSVLKRVDATRAEIDAALSPAESDPEVTDPEGQAETEVTELDGAAPVVPDDDATPVVLALEALAGIVVESLTEDEAASLYAAMSSLSVRIGERFESVAA
jgi:hypothetical protein